MYPKEEEIRALGEESNFFDRENAKIELGEHIKTYRYGLQTFVERHKNGFVIYHLGNKKIYRKEEARKVFKTAKILGRRERELNRLFGY